MRPATTTGAQNTRTIDPQNQKRGQTETVEPAPTRCPYLIGAELIRTITLWPRNIIGLRTPCPISIIIERPPSIAKSILHAGMPAMLSLSVGLPTR